MTESRERDERALSLHIGLFFVQLAFASGALAGKLAFAVGVDPSALAFVRAASGALAFHVAVHVVRRARGFGGRGSRSAAPREATAKLPQLQLIGLAVLGVAVNQAFFLHGLKRGTASSAALLAATIPIFTAAVGMLVGRERPTARVAFGIAVATLGVLALTGVRDVSVGNLLVTINSLSYAGYLVWAVPLIRRHGALVVVAMVFTYGALILAPFGLVPLVAGAPHWSLRAWLLVAWFIAVPTVFAYLTNAWALGRARPSVVAAYVYLQPLLVMLFAGRLLGESLTTRTIVAAAAIFVGLAIVATRGKASTAGRESRV